MDFEWNRDKAAINLKKLRIDFADAATVFDDLNAITIENPGHDEFRFITIRLDADIVDYFKAQVHKAGGGNYQTMINSALRQDLDKKQAPMNEATLRRVIREELRATR